MWSEIDVNLNRLVWIRWFGIPQHAWNDRFFNLVCSKLGLFIRMEDPKYPRCNLEFAIVLLSTSFLSMIDKAWEVCIDGRCFKSRVTEEPKWVNQEKKYDPENSEEESKSQCSEEENDHNQSLHQSFSRENYFSDGPAAAEQTSDKKNSNFSEIQMKRRSIVTLENDSTPNPMTAKIHNSPWCSARILNVLRRPGVFGFWATNRNYLPNGPS